MRHDVNFLNVSQNLIARCYPPMISELECQGVTEEVKPLYRLWGLIIVFEIQKILKLCHLEADADPERTRSGPVMDR